MELKFAPVFLGYTYSSDVTSLLVLTPSQKKGCSLFKVSTALVQAIYRAWVKMRSDPSAQTVPGEISLATLYHKRKERYSELKEIGSLRWELPSKFSEDGLALPPHEQP